MRFGGYCHFLQIHGHSLESDPYSVFNCLSVCLSVCSDDNDTKCSKLLRASLHGTSGYEVSKGDCIITGEFNHGNIQWDTQQSTGVEDQMFMCLIQDNLFNQHVLETTRVARVLDILVSSQK